MQNKKINPEYLWYLWDIMVNLCLNYKEWNESEMKSNKQIEFMTKGIPFCWN